MIKMFNFTFRSRTIKAVIVSCASCCCLAITIYSCITTSAVSKSVEVWNDNIYTGNLSTGTFNCFEETIQ